MNVKTEKVTDKFIALSCQQVDNEYIGFYFGNKDAESAEAECTLFSSMLRDVADKLTSDEVET